MGNLGKTIGDTGFEKLPKVQYITQSGHTGFRSTLVSEIARGNFCDIDLLVLQSGTAAATTTTARHMLKDYF